MNTYESAIRKKNSEGRCYPVKVRRDYFQYYVRGTVGWHWHDELEFAVVLSGEVVFDINETSILLTAGDGIFINSGYLHRAVMREENSKSLLFSITFPATVLAPSDSYIYEQYILPFLADKKLCGFSLSKDTDWQKNMLAKLNSIYALDSHPRFASELQMQTLLGEVWYILLQHKQQLHKIAAPSLEKKKSEERIKKMLTYIQENYPKEITVPLLSEVAGISQSECFRCFSGILHKKPITYVNEYRIDRAMHLLTETRLPVSEICARCGFHHESYFGKWFRKSTGMTPGQYRKQENNR